MMFLLRKEFGASVLAVWWQPADQTRLHAYQVRNAGGGFKSQQCVKIRRERKKKEGRERKKNPLLAIENAC